MRSEEEGFVQRGTKRKVMIEMAAGEATLDRLSSVFVQQECCGLHGRRKCLEFDRNVNRRSGQMLTCRLPSASQETQPFNSLKLTNIITSCLSFLLLLSNICCYKVSCGCFKPSSSPSFLYPFKICLSCCTLPSLDLLSQSRQIYYAGVCLCSHPTHGLCCECEPQGQIITTCSCRTQ